MKIKNYLLSLTVMNLALGVCAQETITPIADTRIDMGSPDTNFGSAVELFVRNGGENVANNEKAYFKFDMEGLLGSGRLILDASFSLMTSRAGSPTTAGSMTVYGIIDNADGWEESEITWSTAPKNDVASGSEVLEGTVVLGTATIPAGASKDSLIIFSDSALTDYLNWAAGAISNPYGSGESEDTKVTFIVVGENAVLGSFYSKEGTGLSERLPQLRVTLSESGESGSWAGYPIDESGDVNTGAFLGWINVTHGDWLWSYSLNRYVYLPDEIVGESGTWMYVLR